MHPILLEIGGFALYSYGAMLVVAFMTANRLLQGEVVRNGQAVQLADDITTAAFVGGLVGAKFWYLVQFDAWDQLWFWTHLDFSSVGAFGAGLKRIVVGCGSGLVFYGGAIGGAVAVIAHLRRRGLSVVEFADMVAPLVFLGYGIGRLGCMLSGDGDYGLPSDLPWPFAASLPNATVPVHTHSGLIHLGLSADAKVLNMPLFEAIAACGLFAWIWSRRTTVSAPGITAASTILAMGAERFIVEWWRLNPTAWSGFGVEFSHAQLVSLVLVTWGIAWILWVRKNSTNGIRGTA